MAIKKEKITYILFFLTIMVTLVTMSMQFAQKNVDKYQNQNIENFNKITLLQSRANIFLMRIMELRINAAFGTTPQTIDISESDYYINNLYASYNRKEINQKQLIDKLMTHFGNQYSDVINDVNIISTDLTDNLKKRPECSFLNCKDFINLLYIFQILIIGLMLYFYILLFKYTGKRYLTSIENKNKILIGKNKKLRQEIFSLKKIK